MVTWSIPSIETAARVVALLRPWRMSRGIEVRRIDVILAGDADEGEESIAARVGESRSHSMRCGPVSNAAHGPIGSNPFSG
jgi:hypothetical protein